MKQHQLLLYIKTSNIAGAIGTLKHISFAGHAKPMSSSVRGSFVYVVIQILEIHCNSVLAYQHIIMENLTAEGSGCIRGSKVKPGVNHWGRVTSTRGARMYVAHV